MPLILASGSPRRRTRLAGCGIPFEVIPASIDERPFLHETAAAYVRRLALSKAEVVARRHPQRLVLGADTIVSLDGNLLGKPVDSHDARRMLTLLKGCTHEVLTGVAVLRLETPADPSPQSASEVVVSLVRLRHYTDATIDWYLATDEPADKAGAYAVQGLGAALVEQVEGSYTNVIGLPLTETLELLRRFGLSPSELQLAE
jgi:septum formation protein